MRAILEKGMMPGVEARDNLEAWSSFSSPRPPNEPKNNNKNTKNNYKNNHVGPVLREIPKPGRPRLLLEMEALVDKELKDHSLPSMYEADSIITEAGDKANSFRLNAYRLAFQRYIDDTKAYNPILNSIKNEYEKSLEAAEQTVQQNALLESEIARIKSEGEIAVANAMVSHKKEIKEKNKKIAGLQEEVRKRERALAEYKKETVQIREDATKDRAEFEEMRNSAVMITKALKRLEEDNKHLIGVNIEKEGEFQSARTSQQKAYDEMERLRHDLQEMERINGGMIAKDIYDEQMRLSKTQEDTIKSLQKEHKALLQRYTNLKGVIDTCFEKHGITEVSNVPRSRGNFNNKPAEQVPLGPAELIKKLDAQGSSPRMVIEGLLDEIEALRSELKSSQGGAAAVEDNEVHRDGTFDDVTSPWSHFDGKGYGKKVPEYLRSSGKIKNLNYSKRECEAHINEVWDAKAKRENALLQQARKAFQSGPIVDEFKDLDKFFVHYIKKTFDKTRGLEFAYNLVDSVQKYSFDSDCRLFYLILTRQVSEEIRGDQMQMLEHVHAEMVKEEKKVRPKLINELPVETFTRALKKSLPTKGQQGFIRLQRALAIETNSAKTINYVDILEEDEDGNQGVFCEMLRTQHLTECLGFTEHITASVHDITEKEGGITTVGILREAIELADNHKSRSEVNALLARGLQNIAVEEVLLKEARKDSVDVEEFLTNLKKGLLKKSAPRRI